jgi:hypothetical protein
LAAGKRDARRCDSLKIPKPGVQGNITLYVLFRQLIRCGAAGLSLLVAGSNYACGFFGHKSDVSPLLAMDERSVVTQYAAAGVECTIGFRVILAITVFQEKSRKAAARSRAARAAS